MQLVGRLTKDPEARTTATGKQYATFGLAVKKRMKPKGADDRDVDFFSCVLWGQNATYALSYLTKGRMVSMTGRHESRTFTDQAGSKREIWEFIADNVHGLDRAKDDEPAEPSEANPPATGPNAYDPYAE